MIIIGAGPGGYETALVAANRGLTVTLVEASEVGGTCLNEGCIPTKAFCRSAQIAEDFAKASEFGFSDADFKLDFAKVAERKDMVVGQLREGVESLLGNPKINLVRGEASLVDDHTIEVGGERYSSEWIIVATGSVSASLPIEGIDLPGVISSREMLALKEVPKRLCVVGAGVIGLEFASIFKSFGSEVSVVEYAKEVLPHFDSDIAKRLRQSLGKRGIEITTQAEVKRISETADGLEVTYSRKGKEATIVADKVLVAVGRKPRTEGLNLETVGVGYDRKGIKVDENMRTSVPNIFAIGDANGLMMLAHAATYQGLRALNTICGTPDKLRLDVMPAAVFTMPELATVGLTEDACKEQGLQYQCRKSFYRANGKALCMGEPDGICKMIIGENGKLLGCHIIGAHSADMIHEFTALMTSGCDLEQLQASIHVHPSLSEVIQSAAHQ